MKKSLTTLFSLFLGFSAFSQEKAEDKGKFTFSGYIDSYYMTNFNNPKDRSNLGASGTARAFDQKSGQFSLGLVQTKIGYSTAKSDVVVDLTFGPNADLGQYGNIVGPLGKSSTALAIKQAYFNWKATDKLTFTAGQFGTHIGYEVIDAPVNYHYSLSNLFNNGPFYHIGVKAAYAFSDKFSIMGGLVNNVDALNDNNGKMGLIAQVFLQPVSGFNVYVNGITSNEASEDITTGKTPSGQYSLLDLTTTYQITEKFMIGLNAATGVQDANGDGKIEKESWGGFAIYPKYDFSSTFSLGARYESFDNSNGIRGLKDATGAGVSVTSITITPSFTVADSHLILKPELRIDSYDKNFFVDGDGKDTKSQATLGLAMIYKF
ncbi:porin [Arcicella sp. LKC2W]|uniref:porin n=1 Tax=Arcicella sp. LKC2W TaxID=2984198 RepID=UPI002B1FE4C2|nr:porin [Arcicella sp. LKC2W]MEA5458502.1 porin [Arcicella sp. LKC2W]